MSVRRSSPATAVRLAAITAVFLLILAVSSAAYAKKKPSRSTARSTSVSASIVTPNNGATVSGRIEWRASASSGSGIRSVRFYIDGSLRVTDTISPYTYVADAGALDTTKLSNGKHVLKIVANSRRQVTRSDSHTVTVANTAPAPTPPVTPPPTPPTTDGEPTGPVVTPPDTLAPSAPTGITASGVSATAATISWTAATDNRGVDHYDVSANGVKKGSSVSSPYVVSLACGTTTSVTVSAVDAAGNSATGSPVNVTTSACPDTAAPTAPTNLASSAITQTAATLSWSAATDNVGVDHYDVFKGSSLLKSVSGSSSTSVSLTCAAASSFTVKAVDAAGNTSAASSALSITGASCTDTTPPSTPTGIAATAITQTSASIVWNASTDNVAIASYDIYRNGAWIDWSMNSPYAMTGLTCGTSYTANVVALDTTDNLASGVPVSFTTSACSTPTPDTTAPSAPSNLAGSGVTQTAATLAWSASTDNVGVTGYRVNQNGSFLKNVSGATSTSVTLSCGVASSFTVQAFDAAGNNSPASGSFSITGAACTTPGDTTPPSAPTGLAASNVTQTGATVTWGASTDNVGVTSYRVNRNGSQAGTTTSGVRTYSFSDLTCGSTYSITITALDAAGNVSTSSPLSVTASACSTGGVTPPSLPGNWSLNFSDEFNGTSLDPKWCTSWFNGGSMNNVTTSPANVSVAGGNLQLISSSSSTGSLINTNPNDCGNGGYTFTTGYYAEARVYFPGNGTQIYNWPAWWTNGQNWPNNGEIDIAEGLGVMSSNYHSPSGANNYFPSGVWSNAFHNYAVLRENGMNYIYFDGNLIRSYASNDGGSPHYLIFNQGGSGVTGAASQLRVDWVRVWKK